MLFGFVESESIDMPDWTDHPSRDRVVNLVRRAPLATTSGGPKGGVIKSRKGRRETKGGVIKSRNGKRYTVNIRPPKWNERNQPCKFWIGKKTYGWAHYLADAIFHYTGKLRVHFKDANLFFPELKCIGTDSNAHVRLTTREERFNYVQSIAGEAFVDQRKEFIRKVLEATESPDFIRQGEELLNSRKEAAAAMPREEAAASREETATPREEAAVPSEAVVRNGDDEYQAEGIPPLEEDPMSLQALREIQFSAPLSSVRSERLYLTPVLHVPGSDTDPVYGLDSSQAYAPSFEINPNSFEKKSLQSVGQRFAMDDCPETLKIDEEGFRNWMDRIAELNKPQKIRDELCG